MNTRSWKSVSSVAVFALVLSTVGGCAAAAEPSGTSEPPVVSEPPVAAPPAAAPKVSSPAPVKANPVGTGATVTVSIDNETGGQVDLDDGTSLVVPPRALPEGVDAITVTSSPAPAPAAYEAASPVYEFGPAGTVFLEPLTVTIPVTFGGGTDLSTQTILWSRPSGEGFDMVPTSFSPNADPKIAANVLAQGEVRHFSRGFCGKKFETDPNPPKDPYASN